MLAKKVTVGSESLLDSDSPEWEKVQGKRMRLAYTPLDRQPSDYVKVLGETWDYGQTEQLWVKSAHNGKEIFFLLEWEDWSYPGGEDDFPDGAGLLFPLKADAPIETMGSKEQPVNAWYWREDADQESGRNFTAEGLGTVVETPNSRTRSRIWARARCKDGRWRLVMGRSLTVEDTAVQFEEGAIYKVSFAVWQGANQERAGFKSYSNSWLDLDLEE